MIGRILPTGCSCPAPPSSRLAPASLGPEARESLEARSKSDGAQPLRDRPDRSTLFRREERSTSIRDVLQAFARAYSAPDLKALATFFTDEADLVDSAGETTRGKSAILEM